MKKNRVSLNALASAYCELTPEGELRLRAEVSDRPREYEQILPEGPISVALSHEAGSGNWTTMCIVDGVVHVTKSQLRQ